MSSYGPVFDVFERDRRLVIGYKMGGTSKILQVCFFFLFPKGNHVDFIIIKQCTIQSLPFLLFVLGLANASVCRRTPAFCAPRGAWWNPDRYV
jgi:hypothetical protein